MALIRFWKKLKERFSFLSNKYFITTILFILWLLVFDQNNILEYRKYEKDYKLLLEDKEYYLQKIKEDKRKLKELQTSTENLEKFAREEYYMKKENEDLFVIIRED